MVELRIDTTRDSPDQIRKVIRYLQSVVGDAPPGASEASNAAPEVHEGMFNIFSDAASTSEPSKDNKAEDSNEGAYIEVVEY
ncbi:hypothetical protein D6789_04595 [Candidatus Woesearchaeota archaeon]|nr:MAG: hypothetical protein D6789_04595 [Candidatus Woesearchaeota archaeon]